MHSYKESSTADVCVCGLTFQGLIDVVVQVVDSQTVFEVGRVLLDPVSHHIDRDITVVLPHLTWQRQEKIKTNTKYLMIMVWASKSEFLYSSNKGEIYIEPQYLTDNTIVIWHICCLLQIMCRLQFGHSSNKYFNIISTQNVEFLIKLWLIVQLSINTQLLFIFLSLTAGHEISHTSLWRQLLVCREF